MGANLWHMRWVRVTEQEYLLSCAVFIYSTQLFAHFVATRFRGGHGSVLADSPRSHVVMTRWSRTAPPQGTAFFPEVCTAVTKKMPPLTGGAIGPTEPERGRYGPVAGGHSSSLLRRS